MHDFVADPQPGWQDNCAHIGEDGRCGWSKADHPKPVVLYEPGQQVFWMRNDFAKPLPITIVSDDGGDVVDFITGHMSVLSTARGNVVVNP